MTHLTTTPFGRRPVTAGQIAQMALTSAPVPVCPVDKWTVLNALTDARERFTLSHRTLSVLSALVSFLPERALSADINTVVFPSNRTLSDRAHGMPESTLRRHLAALVRAGLILRHDSPNGKRFASRGQGGAIDRAFGFDLRPLLVRSAEILDAAETARRETELLRALREEVVLQIRDATKLAAYCRENRHDTGDVEMQLADLRTRLRRRLDREQLEALKASSDDILTTVQAILDISSASKTSGNDSRNERHIQDSNQNTFDKNCEEDGQEQASNPGARTEITLPMVLRACPDVLDYAPGGIRHWNDLLATADMLHAMLGVTRHAWEEAKAVMGPLVAATALVGILQKGLTVSNPGGYLRALTRKASRNAFCPGRMLRAMMQPGHSGAAGGPC